jgi:hypothetical protein
MLRYRQSSDMETGGRVSLSCFTAPVFILSEFCRHLDKMADRYSQDCIVVKMRCRGWICSHPHSDTAPVLPGHTGLSLNSLPTKAQATGSRAAGMKPDFQGSFKVVEGLGSHFY